MSALREAKRYSIFYRRKQQSLYFSTGNRVEGMELVG